MLYRPSPSLTTLRTFSIRAGLAASTVTPGSTAPDVSFTTPAMPLACWAPAAGANTSIPARATKLRPASFLRTMIVLLAVTWLVRSNAPKNFRLHAHPCREALSGRPGESVVVLRRLASETQIVDRSIRPVNYESRGRPDLFLPGLFGSFLLCAGATQGVLRRN